MKKQPRDPGQVADGKWGGKGLRTAGFARPILKAFTLVEVMIASGIFFMAIFAILALVSSSLRNARSLRRPQVDAGMAAAVYVSTNRFSEGTMSGDFDDVLNDYSWTADTYQFATNGLLQADIMLHHHGRHEPADAISILVYDPNFSSTPFSGRR